MNLRDPDPGVISLCGSGSDTLVTTCPILQDPVTGKITYQDAKDGLTYEWDEEKKAWFPAIGEDFMAMYQLNYGFTK